MLTSEQVRDFDRISVLVALWVASLVALVSSFLVQGAQNVFLLLFFLSTTSSADNDDDNDQYVFISTTSGAENDVRSSSTT